MQNIVLTVHAFVKQGNIYELIALLLRPNYGNISAERSFLAGNSDDSIV
jgi:hypothetical protein